MDYQALLKDSGRTSRVGVIGATKGYGYTLLAQMVTVSQMQLRAVCSRHTDECLSVLREIGYEESKFRVCTDETQILEAPEDAIIVTADYRLVLKTGVTSIVESTGNVSVGTDAALRAIGCGINVYMVSKEVDSVCGTELNRLAAEKGVIYTLVNGDQPRNLLDLISWARVLGLEIVCAGKSSEYDFIYNRESREFLYNDGNHTAETIPGLSEAWHYEGVQTLKKREELLSSYCESISADLCEMNLVSNVSGLLPASKKLHYPIARPGELADIFIPKEDGGILDRTGVVDVFYNFRDVDEASFCGGEFIVVRCQNKKMWDILAGKGHVMSRDGKYCCIYHPYHFMGLETPVSILMGDLRDIGTHPETRQVSLLTGRAKEDIPEGTVLRVEGHHHEIRQADPELLEVRKDCVFAPYYLLNGAKVVRPVKKGEVLRPQDVEIQCRNAYELYEKGLSRSM